MQHCTNLHWYASFRLQTNLKYELHISEAQQPALCKVLNITSLTAGFH